LIVAQVKINTNFEIQMKKFFSLCLMLIGIISFTSSASTPMMKQNQKAVFQMVSESQSQTVNVVLAGNDIVLQKTIPAPQNQLNVVVVTNSNRKQYFHKDVGWQKRTKNINLSCADKNRYCFSSCRKTNSKVRIRNPNYIS